MTAVPSADRQNDRAVSALRWAVLLGSLSFGILQFALPIYARQLGANAFDIGGVISIFAAMLTVARPLVGWGIDRWGRKRFLAASFVFYALSMLLFGLARTVGSLYVARLVQGVGSALFWIPAYTTATELSSHGWGRSVGSVEMASSRGAFFGAFVGYGVILLASSFAVGWRWAFGGYTLAALLAAAMVWRSVPETKAAPAPSADAALLDRKFLLRLMIIVFLTGASSSMITPLLIIFLQDHFTTNVPTLAAAFVPAAIVYSYLPGRLGGLSDRFGRAPIMAIGLIGAGVVSIGMPTSTSLVFLAVLWVLEAVGLSAELPAEAALVADLAGQDVRGRGYGLYMFASGLGLTVGPLIGGWLYDSAGHAVPFIVTGGILFLGAALVLLLLRRPQQPVVRSAEEANV